MVQEPMTITHLTSFSVESVYSITGRGTVVTGRVTHGAIKTGQEVELLGFGKSAKAKVTGKINIYTSTFQWPNVT